jgi:hypothetical protein
MAILLDSNGDFNRLIGVIPHFILPIHLSLVCSESRRLARLYWQWRPCSRWGE